jgi:hypothetical protein
MRARMWVTANRGGRRLLFVLGEASGPGGAGALRGAGLVRLGARWRGAGAVAWRVLADAVLGRPGDVAGRAELRRGELGQSGSEAGPEASGAGGLLLARGRAGGWSKAGQAVCGVAERAGAGAWGRAKRDGELVRLPAAC